MPNNHILYAAFLSFVGYAVYAFGDAIAKHLTLNGFSPLQIPFIYCAIASICLLLFSHKLGGARSVLLTKHKKLHFYRALLFAPGQMLNFYAFSKLPMANVYSILFMMPFITTVLANIFLDEKTEGKAWLCIIFGFIGVLIVNRPDVSHLTWPMLACLASACMSASRNIIARKIGYEETTFSLSFIPLVAIMIASAIPAFQYEFNFTLLNMSYFLLGGICFAAGTILVSLSFLQKVNLSLITPFHYTQIIWGILLGVLIFGDYPDFYTWVGCALIIASGIALIRVHHIKKSV